MRVVGRIVLLTFFLKANASYAQSSFDREQCRVFETSANQWLVQELKAANPRYFDCSKPLWKLPEPGYFTLYGDTFLIDKKHINRYNDLWFPKGDCKQFLSLVAMADLYMPLFKRKAEQYRLHPDIAYLPIVLSGCNQQFSNEDAAGLWALTPEAAAQQQLRIDTLVDERRGGDFTTDAALKQIASIARSFGGDCARASLVFKWGALDLADGDSLIRGDKLIQTLNQNASDFLLFQAYTIQLLRGVRTENQLTNCFDILGHFQPIIIERPMKFDAIAIALNVGTERLRACNPVFTGAYLMPNYLRVPFVLEDTLIGRYQSLKDNIGVSEH